MKKVTILTGIATLGMLLFSTTGVFANADNGFGKKVVEGLQAQVQSLETQVQILAAKLTTDDNIIKQQQETIDALQTKQKNSLQVPVLSNGMTVDEFTNTIGRQADRIQDNGNTKTYYWRQNETINGIPYDVQIVANEQFGKVYNVTTQQYPLNEVNWNN